MNEPEEKKPLLPRRVINIKGKISYSEGAQSWSVLRFKKELLKEFFQLNEKRSKFSYKMSYYRTIEELEKIIKEIKKQKESSLPILMWLYREE